MFSIFGRTAAPQVRECRTSARHYLAYGTSLWRVATFKSSLGAARHSTDCEAALYNTPISPDGRLSQQYSSECSDSFTEQGLSDFNQTLKLFRNMLSLPACYQHIQISPCIFVMAKYAANFRQCHL